MVRPGWPRQPIAARSSPQSRRFPHLINADKVFGTHRPGWPKQTITARSSPQSRRFPHLINAHKVFGTHSHFWADYTTNMFAFEFPTGTGAALCASAFSRLYAVHGLFAYVCFLEFRNGYYARNRFLDHIDYDGFAHRNAFGLHRLHVFRQNLRRPRTPGPGLRQTFWN